ncbi:unnamed protein product, partial [Symbiodinium sp. CCMP2456]
MAASLTADAEVELRSFFAAELPTPTSRRAATSALCALLAEPLAYDYTRRLLTSEADAVAQELNHIAGGQSRTRWPSEGAAFCSVREARDLYQPALQRRVQLLLQASADPNGRVLGQGDWHCPPQSPLMCCAIHGWQTVAQTLLHAKAAPSQADVSGGTALHAAATHGEETYNFQGTPTSRPDNYGHEEELYNLLLKAAADPNQKDLVTDLRAHLTDTVGLDLSQLRHDALSETEVLFASILGLMREQTLSSTVLCPVIYRFPEQLCGSWFATPEGQRAKAFLDARGDAMDHDKMWQLMLYTWLGAGGVDGLPWQHVCATPGLTRYDTSPEQAMAVVKFAMSYTQLCGNHVLKFFGSDDFLSKMYAIDGFGHLAVKEVLSYLGVSGHERFHTMAIELIPFGPGAKNGASVFFGCTRKLLQLATNLQPRIQDHVTRCFPNVEPGVTVVDIEIFLCYGYTYCKMVQQLRS